MALAGLGLQVAVIFCLCLADSIFRYPRSSYSTSMAPKMRIFFKFLSLAIVWILGCCAYRCYEFEPRIS